jgi:hypothetical protein
MQHFNKLPVFFPDHVIMAIEKRTITVSKPGSPYGKNKLINLIFNQLPIWHLIR